MAIIFHCDHCGKKIEAPDSAGGKWGKCPACHNKLYVPSSEVDEELKLAPIDESEEERKRRLMAEAHKLTQDILQERDVPNEPAEVAKPVFGMGERELTKNIIMYLRQMADDELHEAQRTVGLIARHGPQAVKILERMALSEIPEPELTDIPRQVLSALIRTLRTEIS
jgi:hypothetical protein